MERRGKFSHRHFRLVVASHATSGREVAVAGLHVPRDDEPLDLRGAFVKLKDFGVAHELLHGILGVEARAAEYLHGVGHHLIRTPHSRHSANAREQGRE